MIAIYSISGIVAYLLGSVPTAVWLGKLKYGIDVREHGSKNAGATNTFRVLGKKPGIVVLVVDIVKGITAVALPHFVFGHQLSGDELVHVKVVAAISAVLGHVFPIFAQFKGGKGVATSLGVVIALHPETAGICLGLFMIVFISSGFVSLGAITAAIAFPIILVLLFDVRSVVFISFSILLSLAVIIAHRKNIKRLLSGTENKMNLFKK